MGRGRGGDFSSMLWERLYVDWGMVFIPNLRVQGSSSIQSCFSSLQECEIMYLRQCTAIQSQKGPHRVGNQT